VTRWGAFRGKGRAPTLRARFCVPCNTERPFRGLRCTVCGQKEPRLSKMGNVPVGRFDSTGEQERNGELEWLVRDGAITDLEHHPRYPLEVNGVLVTTFEPDWHYRQDGVLVVEDWKGFATETYQFKKRLLLALYGIAVKETGPGRDRPRHQKRRAKVR